ncbi:MAG: hypothetical protein AB7V50_08725 [Vampirovibrionia bacterium]|jgi:hypothetical protein
MKKYLALLLFACIATLSFGQSNYQDVVYLKNGSIIRGVIIEQVPNKSIKIETTDRNVFVYQMDEIEKLTKEITAQDKIVSTSNKRKGFIGLSIGASIPVGDFADKSNGLAKTGLQLNLINFGYLFSDNFGIVATWFGAVNPIDADGIDPWSYGGLMAGPLLSFPISPKADWDFKPMIGYSVTTVPDIGYGTEQATSFAFSVGTQFRIHVGNKVSLLLSADYFSAKPEFKDYGFEQNIGTLSIGLGIAYRLK